MKGIPLAAFDPDRTWFTADTHFGHARIIGLCCRPFADVAEMDRNLIDAWNSRVAPDDHVFHLGDFAFRNAEAAASYRARLAGRVHLIWGNHDPDAVREAGCWETSSPYAEVRVGGTRLVLFHYGMRVWNGHHRGTLHLYGHSHGSLPGDSASADVGVDCPEWGWGPVRLADLRRRLKRSPQRPLFGPEERAADEE